MAILNMVASGGGGSINSSTFSVRNPETSLNTISTNTIPSWYLLVCDECTSGMSNLITKIDSGAYAPVAVASVYATTSVRIGRITATVSITNGKLRFATTSSYYFRGSYTLYYMD